MTDKLSDSWQTPKWLFDELNKEFHFDIDLCAITENSKVRYFANDYLNNIFQDSCAAESYRHSYDLNFYREEFKTAWMNPPYSNPKPFIEKAWEDSKYCKIVCLVKCDPSTKWWATFWNYEDCYYCIGCEGKCKGNDCTGNIIRLTNEPKPGCEVRFFPKRIKFDPPKGLDLKCDCWAGLKLINEGALDGTTRYIDCPKCKGKGIKQLSGPTFPCALIIMDRRGL